MKGVIFMSRVSSEKKLLPIGTRVEHKTDSSLKEGVIVWVYKNTVVQPDKCYQVFWSNNKRGIYCKNEIVKSKTTFKGILTEE